MLGNAHDGNGEGPQTRVGRRNWKRLVGGAWPETWRCQSIQEFPEKTLLISVDTTGV
jgi:hypothetical protein